MQTSMSFFQNAYPLPPPQKKAVYTLVLFYIFIRLPIGSDHNLQVVRSVASGSKFYWLPPDKRTLPKGNKHMTKA